MNAHFEKRPMCHGGSCGGDRGFSAGRCHFANGVLFGAAERSRYFVALSIQTPGGVLP